MIFGRKGSGKTTLTQDLVRHHSRVFIVDPHREYTDAAVVISSLEELESYLRSTRGRWRIAYSNEQLEEDFDQLCLAAHALGRCLFVVEEADMFCTPALIPDELRRLVNYGRHPDRYRPGAGVVHLLATSRAPADVHRALTRNAYEVYCFTVQEPRDLEYLTKYVGKNFADALPGLAPLHYRKQNLWDRTQAIEEHELSLSRNLPAAVV